MASIEATHAVLGIIRISLASGAENHCQEQEQEGCNAALVVAALRVWTCKELWR